MDIASLMETMQVDKLNIFVYHMQINEEKKIAVNNLSKWLFGVPGAKGYLTITRAGDYIQLPGNTPDEAVELIETILREKSKGEHSK